MKTLRSFSVGGLLLLFLLSRPLHAALKDMPSDDAVTRIDALAKEKKLSKTMSDEMIAVLKSNDADIRVKERAAWALGQLKDKRAIPELIHAAHHKGLLVRSAALGSLSRMRAKAAFPVFVSIAESDPVLSMRQRATVALGLLQTEKAIQPLVKLSSDPAPEVRAAATFGMAALHSKKNDFSQALGEMAADQSNFVQDRAKQGLDIVHRKNTAVMKHLGSDDSDERLFAALYFQNHGTHKDLATLKTKWEGESDEDVKLELEAAMKAVKKRSAGTAPTKKKSAAKTKPT